jgi:hypothetical protein
MDDLSAAKTQLDTANSAIKLFEPFLKRAETWRFGQRLDSRTNVADHSTYRNQRRGRKD